MAMNNFINTSSLIPLTIPGQMYVQDVYETVKKTWEPEFKEIAVNRNNFPTSETEGTGAARLTLEQGASQLGTIQMAGQKSFQILNYTMMVGVTLQMLQDNLYESMAPKYWKTLLQSQLERCNIEAANVLNNALSASNPGWDGLPYLSNAHPVSGGTLSNKVDIDSPLNEDTIFEMLTNMWGFRAPSGIRIDSIFAEVLLISPEIARQAFVLLESKYRPGTSSFEANPSERAFPRSFKVNRYLKSNAYFVRTNQDGLWFFNRFGFHIAQQPNVSIWAILISTIMRYKFDFDNFRSLLGGESGVAGNT